MNPDAPTTDLPDALGFLTYRRAAAFTAHVIAADQAGQRAILDELVDSPAGAEYFRGVAASCAGRS